MTSLINPNNINGAYPVAGQDNNSQGFRDNFTNTSNNFQYAAQEITDLQNKVIVSAQLTGGNVLTTQNNMLGAPLINAVVSDFAWKAVALGALSSTVTINYVTGHFQTVTTDAPITLAFTNWPTAGQMGEITVQITVVNVTHTVTLPAAVSINATGIQGYNSSTRVITFAAVGTYTFTFSTVDGGTSIAVNESNKALQPYNNSADAVTSGSFCSLATTTSYFTTAGTATLQNGVQGQIKVLTQTFLGSMVVNVPGYGWTTGTGNITLPTQGSSCTLQYINNGTASKWYCIGNNGATFS